MTRVRREIVTLNLRLIIIALAAVHPKHLVGQALRRAFLCGEDQYSQYNYDHRRQWFLDRLTQLTDVFVVKIASCSNK